MRKTIFKGAKIGATTGFITAVCYVIIINVFFILFNLILRRPIYFQYYPEFIVMFILFVILPAIIICPATSVIFVFTLKTLRLRRILFTIGCIMISFIPVIGVYLYNQSLLQGLVYNIDPATTNWLMSIFVTVPCILYIIWSFFISQYIYLNFMKSLDVLSPSS